MTAIDHFPVVTPSSPITPSSPLINRFLSAPVVTHAVKYVTTPHFRVLQGICLCGYGLKEIVFDAPRAPNTSLCTRIGQAVSNLFSQIQSSSDFFIQHGILFMGCGIAGAALAFQQVRGVPWNAFHSVLQGSDFGFFFAASLVGLRYNVLNYLNSQNPLIKKSSILGIISNLNYLFWCLSPFLGLSATLSLIFCCIALSTGCLKILFDYFKSL